MRALRPRALAAATLLALAAALAGCGGSGGGRSSDGIVGRLTGDDDAEVSDELERQVERAFAVPADGDPVEVD